MTTRVASSTADGRPKPTRSEESSAFYHLGDIPDPATGQKAENLPAVKQTIDILIMLQNKTKNNLDAEEAKLMEQLIYELQVKYVAKTKTPK